MSGGAETSRWPLNLTGTSGADGDGGSDRLRKLDAGYCARNMVIFGGPRKKTGHLMSYDVCMTILTFDQVGRT